MSTTQYEKASQRYIANATLLCDLLHENTKKGTTGAAAIDQMLAKMIAYVNSAIKLDSTPENPELKSFMLSNGIQNIVDPNYEDFIDSIEFLIACTNPYVRNVAAKLLQGADVQKKKSIKNTVLFKAFAINYLTRNLCVFCEALVDRHGGDKIDDLTGPNAQLLGIWYQAQCARSGSFDKPYNIDGDEDKTIKVLQAEFSKAQKSPMCPFNKEVHRRRAQGPDIDNNERYLLSLGAGAAKARILSDSTLGHVQRALGLPERCDISGTTTDAVGVASFMKSETPGDAEIRPNLFVLSCIVSMCLQGHHSLSEMAAGASLSSKGNYNPLQPGTVKQVLDNLYKTPLPTPIGNLETIGSPLVGIGKDDQQWFSDEWLAISEFSSDRKLAKKEWEFNDSNWRVWKMFANTMNHPSQ